MDARNKKKLDDTNNLEQNRKPRVQKKAPSGLLRDKERSKARLINAVGKVLQKEGYVGLNAASVAAAAGLSKKLVWTYFDGLDNLVEEYISKRDFWKQAAYGTISNLLKHSSEIGKEHISKLLQAQLQQVLKDKILQKIIHWELGESKEILRKLADKREEIGEGLFKLIIDDFENNGVHNLRGRFALIIGGIYYLSIHAKVNGSTFCGVDLNTKQGQDEVSSAIEDFVFETYSKAGL